MNIEQTISERMRGDKIYPEQAVQMRQQLAGTYAFYSEQLEYILLRKPKVWLSMRINHKSDKATDREWDTTEDGINEIGLTMRLKKIEKMMSSLKSIIDNAATEYAYTNNNNE